MNKIYNESLIEEGIRKINEQATDNIIDNNEVIKSFPRSGK